MAISPVGGALPSLPSIPTSSVTKPQATEGTGFAEQVQGALSNLNALHNNADALAEQAAVGSLEDVHDYTIAATEAAIATELTVAVRNRAVEAFQEIMRMPI